MTELTEPQKKWIAALRSGEYRQGKAVLCNGRAHCCLGVACELFAGNFGYEKQPGPVPNTWMWAKGPEAEGYRPHEFLPPPEIWKHLGLVEAVGPTTKLLYGSLVDMNDRGMSFDEIATALESGDFFVKESV